LTIGQFFTGLLAEILRCCL